LDQVRGQTAEGHHILIHHCTLVEEEGHSIAAALRRPAGAIGHAFSMGLAYPVQLSLLPRPTAQEHPDDQDPRLRRPERRPTPATFQLRTPDTGPRGCA